MSNVDLEQHAFGYVVGDRVRVFTRTGYWTATVEKITSAGRLNLRDKDGKLIQFSSHGAEVGKRTTSVWSAPLRSIELKHKQEERALEISKRNRAQRAQQAFGERLDTIKAIDLNNDRDKIADCLRNLTDAVLQGTLK